ncbi:MAG: glycosyltransferase [Ilumatobacteraceae bacterium]
MVLIEAMAANTCIVASSLDGYRNVATFDDVDSLLVPPGDATALAGALQRALNDPALAGRLVTAGAGRADDFSMVALAGHYQRIYRALHDAAGRPTRQLSPWPRAPRLGRRARMMAR